MNLDEICARAKANIDRNKDEILALAAKIEKRCLLDWLADCIIAQQDEDEYWN